MKIERKKGIGGIKFTHNKKLFWIIIALIILLIVLIYFIAKNNGNDKNGKDNTENNVMRECSVDSDCDQVCGCHPSSCIPLSKKPVCERMFCTMDCSGPLDCGAGHCGCVNGKCSVVSN